MQRTRACRSVLAATSARPSPILRFADASAPSARSPLGPATDASAFQHVCAVLDCQSPHLGGQHLAARVGGAVLTSMPTSLTAACATPRTMRRNRLAGHGLLDPSPRWH